MNHLKIKNKNLNRNYSQSKMFIFNLILKKKTNFVCIKYKLLFVGASEPSEKLINTSLTHNIHKKEKSKKKYST